MKRLAFLVCLASAYAFGQGGAATSVPAITNTRGEPVPYAQVGVCTQNPGSAPATVCNGFLASTYTDISLGLPCTLNVSPVGPVSGTSCTNPGKSDGLGNVVAFATPGQYWCEYYGGSITRPMVLPCFFPNGTNTANLNCPAALNGSFGAFTAPTTFSCDPNMGTDFHGNGFSQSWKYLGPVNGFFGVIGGAPDPGTVPAYALNANEVRMLAPLTAPTPYYFRVPSTPCAVGQVWNVTSSTTDANGNTVTTYGCLTPSAGGGVQGQVNGSNTANCAGGPPCLSPLLNFTDPTVTAGGFGFTNPSGGIVKMGTPFTQVAAPSAPTCTVGGTPGGATVTYVVQLCEDGGACTAHTTTSTCTVNTANATLSSSPITIKNYADTTYGWRCANIYRTVGGPSQGLIANCAWKDIIDNGITASAGSPTNTNTTSLWPNMNPTTGGCNYPPGSPTSISGPPCSPNAQDYEFTDTYCFASSTLCPDWSTTINIGSSTVTLTNGALVFVPQAANAANQLRLYCLASYPSTPYTFVMKAKEIAPQAGSGSPLFDIGFAVTDGTNAASSKVVAFTSGVNHISSEKFTSSQNNVSGNYFDITSVQHDPAQWIWIKWQDTGTNFVWSYSFDGIAYYSDPTSGTKSRTDFLTPANFCFEGSNAGTNNPTITIDYIRRTQ